MKVRRKINPFFELENKKLEKSIFSKLGKTGANRVRWVAVVVVVEGGFLLSQLKVAASAATAWNCDETLAKFAATAAAATTTSAAAAVAS
jgi:hypothetical protein